MAKGCLTEIGCDNLGGVWMSKDWRKATDRLLEVLGES